MNSDARIKGLLIELRGRYAIPRKKAADELVQIGAASVPGLIETLDNKSAEAQQAAANALLRIGSRDALEAVQRWRQQSGQ